MKLPFSVKTLASTAVLLILMAAVSHLVAQDTSNFASTTPQGFSTVTAFPARTYTGTATQISAAGVTTTGTFILSYFKGGNLSATTTFNGVSTTYEGLLPQISSGGIRGERSGFLFASTPLPDAGNGTVGYATTIIPLVLDKMVAYGGLQSGDGSLLTFHSVRQTK